MSTGIEAPGIVRRRCELQVQLGGADVLTYREMMARYAALAGRRHRPLIKVPFFTPRLSSYWSRS